MFTAVVPNFIESAGNVPRDETSDTLVFLGDLIDRGPDAPGCVDHVLKLQRENPERVICLRGNHEQMLLDFIEGSATFGLLRSPEASERLSSMRVSRWS